METKQERRERRVATIKRARRALFDVRCCIGGDSPEAKDAKRLEEKLERLWRHIASERLGGDTEVVTLGRPPRARYSVTHWTDCEKCAARPTVWCGDDECCEGVREERDCQCDECADRIAGISEDAADFAAEMRHG